MADYWRFAQLCDARWTRLPLMCFFHNEDFPKIVGLCLECYSHTYMMQYIKCIFSPNIYWIRASISIRRWKKIAFDQNNRVGFMALLLIKQKCIEPSTNMKQVSTLCFLFTWNQQVNCSYSPNMFWSFVLATLMSRIDDSVCLWLLFITEISLYAVYFWTFFLCCTLIKDSRLFGTLD